MLKSKFFKVRQVSNFLTLVFFLAFIRADILFAGGSGNKGGAAGSEAQDGQPSVHSGINPPPGFLLIKANPAAGADKDFYVAKFEMKILGMGDGNQVYGSSIGMIAESRASGTPWVNITQEQAKKECKAMGKKYALITNAEWIAVAREIESVPENWSDNNTHPSGRTFEKLNIGHSCRRGRMGRDCRVDSSAYSGGALSASIDDEEGCYGYKKMDKDDSIPKLNENGWNLYRRTHYLNGGQLIWDFSGNAWEWVDWTVPKAVDRARASKEVNDDWIEINNAKPKSTAMSEKDYQSANTDMNGGMNMNGLGRYHPSTNDKAGAAMRGGSYMEGSYINGIYALGMDYAPDDANIPHNIGFRCVWHPDW